MEFDESSTGLSALQRGIAAFKQLSRQLDTERASNAELAMRASLLEDASVALRTELEEHQTRTRKLEDELATARAGAEAQRERGDRLLIAVQEMHRALFAGSTSEYVLRAALRLTDAERGYYVAEDGDGLRVRACVDVPASVGAAPSPFIAEIARRVLAEGEPVRWGEDGPPELGALPADGESFRSGAAVVVSVHGAPHGAIIVLDKDGHFNDADLESMLAVGRQAGVAVENARLRRDVQQAYVSMIAVLADTVEAKDPYVQGHCRHGVPALRDVASAVLYHHERFDGRGYPEGLSGERIPIAARIVGAVDAYCAMLDARSYKPAYTPEHARDELLRNAGTQFDPRVVDAVVAAIESEDGRGALSDQWPRGDDCSVLPHGDRLGAGMSQSATS
jgi:HD-GYP domain-containing protein (c-di-GMP phosphodiesterase class II)